MTGSDLREARKNKGWTQQEAARRLGVSQEYLSMMERGLRKVPQHLIQALLKKYAMSPLAFPLHGPKAWATLDADEVAAELAGLGYPGFAHKRTQGATWNPAELLVAALTRDNLDRRVAEGLPWLALHFNDMDWNWVAAEAKIHDAQNRLGFVVTLARELAELKRDLKAAQRLRSAEAQLMPSLLAQVGTFCHESMTPPERKWLQEKSTAEARQWNLLCDLAPEHLPHAI